ncbi:ABC transporter ATP-binding protein [Actinomadura sp. NPDC048021]|uniref:ABC transporter ATP-binding protein n=1 Tax=Actinomadura sp. NPDC048021 TaxID=3155385 RepID=UPI00340D0A63
MTASAPPLEADEIYRFYRAGDEETRALRGISLAVAAGEFVAVTGPSGSGKSTLLACLGGLDEPDGGTVRVGGVRISHRPQVERTALRAHLIGMLFQSGNMLEHLTVRANVDLVQRLAGRPDPAWRNTLLDELGLADRDRARPAQLSGGESARAGLAVALANRPAVLLADEPTGELDRRTERRVLDLLRDRAAQGTAVVVASHSPAVAAAADRTLTLDEGRPS